MKKSNKKEIKDAVIACTEKCDSRCRMCNIWKKDNASEELTPADFLYLPENLTNINISGGEPFLRQDIPEIVVNIKKRCKKAKIIFSTNGFASERILETMKKILKIDKHIGVVVSIDGIKEKHDEIRGVVGGFDKSLKTIEELKKLKIDTKIAFTLADYNFEELKKVYDLSLKLNVEMSLALVHSSDNYFSIKNDIVYKREIINSLDWLVKKELSTYDPKRWLRAYFTHGLKIFAETEKRILPNYSGERSIFISSKGDVYPSDVDNKKIGKLNSIDKFKINKDEIGELSSSWMICTARTAIKKHFLKVGFWILKNKIKNYFFDRSNSFYYLTGLLFMTLNKFRYYILGYHNPRPIAKGDIGRNITYSKNVVNNFLKYSRKAIGPDFTFLNKNCLEIGPGSDFGTGLTAVSMGAKSYTGVDRFNLLSLNGDFYDSLSDSLDFEGQERIKFLVSDIKKSIIANKKGEIELSNFKYINTAFEEIRERVKEKYDVIFSQAVLEHTYDTEKVFEEMSAVLNTGGIVVHEIDFATHTTLLRDADPLNILRFSDKVYDALKFKGAPNRLRVSDYKRIAQERGFKNVRIYPLNVESKNKIEKIKNSFKSKYKLYAIDDLRILSAVLVAEKND